MNIGFISTRLAGTDGVSLETAKLATICRGLGHQVFYCAGEFDGDGPPGLLVPEMHFTHPEARWIYDHSFGATQPAPDLRQRIARMAGQLQAAVGRFVADFEIDLLFVQNALAIPMQVPLGVALTDFIAETGIPTIAHNHDLYWERPRFRVNCIADILARAFPPNLPSVHHVVINSLAQAALRERVGAESTLLPNIFDYATAAPALTEFNHDLRDALVLTEDHLFILQPTRVIPRKGIELAIELVRRLGEPRHRQRLPGKQPVLVITHAAGDEGLAYLRQLEGQAEAAAVHLISAADRFAPTAQVRDGQKIYALWDAYVHADFVTYPSSIEGFGNALLETLYFRLPALVNRYDVYVADIAPCGFDLIEIEGAITERAIEAAVQVIQDPVRRRRMVEHNYHVASQHYSYEAVTPTLESLLGKW